VRDEPGVGGEQEVELAAYDWMAELGPRRAPVCECGHSADMHEHGACILVDKDRCSGFRLPSAGSVKQS
jgi:hypothetical protein